MIKIVKFILKKIVILLSLQYMSVMEVVSSVKNSGGTTGEPTDGILSFESGKRVKYAKILLNLEFHLG
jgi:hypothetical protein